MDDWASAEESNSFTPSEFKRKVGLDTFTIAQSAKQLVPKPANMMSPAPKKHDATEQAERLSRVSVTENDGVASTWPTKPLRKTGLAVALTVFSKGKGKKKIMPFAGPASSSVEMTPH